MATQLALWTALDADQAKAILVTAPAANPYLAAMDREGPIGINADAPNFTDGDAKAARMKEIRANVQVFNESRGFKAKG
jgi:hypothetical protein